MNKKTRKTNKRKEEKIVNHHHHYWDELKEIKAWKLLTGFVILILCINLIQLIDNKEMERKRIVELEETEFKACLKACSKDYHINHLPSKDNHGILESGEYRFVREVPIYEDYDRTPCIKECITITT